MSARLPTRGERLAAANCVNNEPFTVAEFAMATSTSVDTSRKTLTRLVHAGRVEILPYSACTNANQRAKLYRRTNDTGWLVPEADTYKPDDR